MFDKLRKRPVLLVILIVLCLVILFAIFHQEMVILLD